MAGEVDDLFKIMPSPEPLRLWHLPVIWFKGLTDPKVASDLIQLALKSLPLVGIILVPLIAPVIYWFRKSIEINYSQNPLLFWIVISAITTWSAILIINKVSSIRLSNRLVSHDVHGRFKIIQFVSTTFVKSKTETVYAFRFVLRSKFDDIENFDFIYHWSGVGECEIFCRNSNYAIVELKQKFGTFKAKSIKLDRKLRKGDELIIEYYIRTNANDNNLPLPHIGIAMYCKKYPTFNTHMILKFSDDYLPIEVYRDYIYADYSLGSVKNYAVGLDDNAIHRWAVRGIEGWIYCLRWANKVD